MNTEILKRVCVYTYSLHLEIVRINSERHKVKDRGWNNDEVLMKCIRFLVASDRLKAINRTNFVASFFCRRNSLNPWSVFGIVAYGSLGEGILSWV